VFASAVFARVTKFALKLVLQLMLQGNCNLDLLIFNVQPVEARHPHGALRASIINYKL